VSGWNGEAQVRVALDGGVFEFSWESRQPLLDRLRQMGGGEEVAMRFERQEAGQVVELSRAERVLLVRVIDDWVGSTGPSADLRRLRDRLAFELGRPLPSGNDE
jgi:hypothetical protein